MLDWNDFILDVIKETLNQNLGASFMFSMAFTRIIHADEGNFVTVLAATNVGRCILYRTGFD
jgi:hypothetical protein